MNARKNWLVFLFATAFSTGSLSAPLQVPGCPQDLETLSHWWESTPDMGQVIEINAWLTFTNTHSESIEFYPDAVDTMQIWSVPDVMDPAPIVFNSWPAGTVPSGENYSYQITMGVGGLPVSQTGLAFRPRSITLGTMGPANAELVSAEFNCIEGVRVGSQPLTPIPTLSLWGQVALLLFMMGIVTLALRRRLP